MDPDPAVPVLSVRDLKASYGKVQALRGVDLEVRRGELVTLIGSNGAGKTTTLKAILNLVPRDGGEIDYQGTSTDRVPAHLLARRGIGVVPEGRRIFPFSTVQENLELGGLARTPPAEAKVVMEGIFETFPILRERRSQRGGSLSGGEQQMLAIGRALMGRPELLLLDEPSMGLAPIYVDVIFGLISKLYRQGVTILLIEQNALMSLEVAARAYVLEQGRTVLSGTAQEVLHNPQVIDAYLGGGMEGASHG
jgi:branched-chain amino acid transport system ATP-binding protein